MAARQTISATAKASSANVAGFERTRGRLPGLKPASRNADGCSRSWLCFGALLVLILTVSSVLTSASLALHSRALRVAYDETLPSTLDALAKRLHCSSPDAKGIFERLLREGAPDRLALSAVAS